MTVTLIDLNYFVILCLSFFVFIQLFSVLGELYFGDCSPVCS